MEEYNFNKDKLVNLDVYLAEIIYKALTEFKNNLPEAVILYSKDWEPHQISAAPLAQEGWDADQNTTDDTQWFLDELIWTFQYIAGDLEPPSAKLFKEMYDELNIEKNLENSPGLLSTHPKYAEYHATYREEMKRISNGMELFQKNFRRLWY